MVLAGYFFLFNKTGIKISGKKIFKYTIIVFLIFMSFLLTLYGNTTPGHDNSEALKLWIGNFFNLVYPYLSLTHLNNPITPLPFLPLYSIPFYFLGNVAYQNIINIIIILFIFIKISNDKKDLNFGLVSLFISVPLYTYFVNQSDNLTVATFTFLALFLIIKNKSKFASILFGLLIASKGYFFVVIPVSLYYLHIKEGYKKMILFLLTAITIAAIITIPFYLWNPIFFLTQAPLGKQSSLITTSLGIPITILFLFLSISISLLSFNRSKNLFVGVLFSLISASLLLREAFFTRTIFLQLIILIFLGITFKSDFYKLKK